MVRLVVRRVDRDEQVDRVIDDGEVAYIVTVSGAKRALGPWRGAPIEWPLRATYAALGTGGLYRLQTRSIRPLEAALPPEFVIAHTGVLVNLERVRFLSRERPLMLGFATDGAAHPEQMLWAPVARGRVRGIEDRLGWIRRTTHDVPPTTGNGVEVDAGWSSTVPLADAPAAVHARAGSDDGVEAS